MIFVLAVVKVAKRDVTAVRSLIHSLTLMHVSIKTINCSKIQLFKSVLQARAYTAVHTFVTLGLPDVHTHVTGLYKLGLSPKSDTKPLQTWVCPLNLTPSRFRRFLHSHLQPFHNITNTAHLFHSTHINIIRKFHAQVLYQICGFISSLKKLHILFIWSKISIIFII